MARWTALLPVLLLWAGSLVALPAAECDDLFGKDVVKEFRALSEAHQYRKLRERMAEIGPKLATGSAELRAEFEALKRDLAHARERWLADRASKQVLAELQGSIRLKVANVKSSVHETLVWAKTRFEKETLAQIAKQLQPLDDVSVAEIRTAWGRRKKGAWHKLAVPRGMTRDKIRADAGWWEKATLAERRERVLLVFITSGGLFELRSKLFWSACPTCKATGLQSKRLAGGQTASYLCPSCRGAQRFAVLGFR